MNRIQEVVSSILIHSISAPAPSGGFLLHVTLLGLVIGVVSFVSLAAAARWRPGHRQLQLALSAVSGLMLGIAFFHLLPHALEGGAGAGEAAGAGDGAGLDGVMLAALAGFLAMFLLERFVCYHHHDLPEPGSAREHSHSHSHPSGHDCCGAGGGSGAPSGTHKLTWVGALTGLSLHALLEGVALGSAATAALSGDTWMLIPWGAFLVIVAHKPFDSLTLGTLLGAAGVSAGKRRTVNLCFALAPLAGALLTVLGLAQSASPEALSLALAFSAGTFICISCSDLLPELHFHSHDRLRLSAALVLGLAVAWGLARMEHDGHDHSLVPGAGAVDHSDHSHHD